MLIRLPEVLRLTGLSRTSVYELEGGGLFPSRVPIGPRAVAWPRDAVVQWCEAKIRAARENAAELARSRSAQARRMIACRHHKRTAAST